MWASLSASIFLSFFYEVSTFNSIDHFFLWVLFEGCHQPVGVVTADQRIGCHCINGIGRVNPLLFAEYPPKRFSKLNPTIVVFPRSLLLLRLALYCYRTIGSKISMLNSVRESVSYFVWLQRYP